MMQEELKFNLKSALEGLVLDSREEIADRDAELKIWVFARKDLPMTLGKFGGQAAHAGGTCMVISDRKNNSVVDQYLSQGQPKIVVAVENEAELVKCVQLCHSEMLVSVLVQDAGRTELQGKTLTIGAVGPCLRSDLPKAVRRLQMFKQPV
ncbi:hypothetical protein GOB57_24645 [Sinorhizobium meliloti]|nr:hypothetical protein [Sinorhizobium meliloti]